MIQLCAQALCLEEMLDTEVPQGAIYYGQPKRRMEVAINEPLRRETAQSSLRLHELHRIGRTPMARYEKKCRRCSLYDHCLPKVTGGGRSAKDYLALAFAPDEEVKP